MLSLKSIIQGNEQHLVMRSQEESYISIKGITVLSSVPIFSLR